MNQSLSNHLAPWIDPRVKGVKVADIEAYLRSRGWQPVASPRPSMLRFRSELTYDDGEPLIQTVPSAELGSDYAQRVIEVVTNLAVVEGRYAVEVLNDILEAGRVGRNGNGQRANSETAEKQPMS